MKDFYNKLRDIVIEDQIRYYSEIDDLIKKSLDRLIREGVIQFNEIKFLGSFALEIKVKHLFTELGFTLESNSNVDCDGIILPEVNFSIDKPIVLEIKSGKSLSPSRDNLRQLDDWIFELSGEELARREGLGKNEYKYNPFPNPLGRHFTKQQKLFHPTPHKGLMVYNSVEGLHFSGSPLRLEFNELEFCKKRNICIISLAQLINFHNQIILSKTMSLNSFWTKIHDTSGCLELS